MGFVCLVKSLKIWILNLSCLVLSKNVSSEFWCWKAGQFRYTYFQFTWYSILRSRQAGVIHKDTFKLSLSIGYTVLSFWNEFIRVWTKLDIKATTVLLFGRLTKRSIFEYFISEYIHHPIVFIKNSPVHDNVLGTNITGEKVNDLEPETVVMFILTGKWTQILNHECYS